MSSKCISMGVVNIVSYDLLSRMTKQMGERLQFRVVIAVCVSQRITVWCHLHSVSVLL